MKLTHAEAREALQLALDERLEATRTADLESHLAACAECRAYAAELRRFEAGLGAALQERWPAAPHGDPRLLLGRLESQDRRDKMLSRFSTPLRGLAWIALALAVVAAFIWAVRSVAPQPAAGRGTQVPSPTHCTTVSYTVQPDDTLAFIAANYGVTVESIRNLNGLPSDVVNSGQTLQIPECKPQDAPPRPTPQPDGTTYDWHGTTLSVPVSLPESPAQADVYALQPDRHATQQQAVALARQLGFTGDLYEITGEIPGSTDYVVTDGKQWLTVRSGHYYTYYADHAKAFTSGSYTALRDDAPAIIDAFLKSHGYDFEYSLDYSSFWGGYYVAPATPGRRPLYHEYFKPSGMLFTLDESGAVASIQAGLVSYDPAGSYAIRTAQEALQILLAENNGPGIMEDAHGPAGLVHSWRRVYRDDQALTLYGRVQSMRSTDPTGTPFVQIDAYTASGNLGGLDSVDPNTYVAATGRFATADGIRRFEVQSWAASPLNEDGLFGTLHRENGQVLLSVQDAGDLVIPDAPADLPLPFENAYVIGTRVENVFEWKTIDDRDMFGGGGGGGGQGFYKLNLSGTPVAFPTPTATPAAETIQGGYTYTVEAGDTLEKIAQANGTTVDELMQLNNLTDPGLLTIGQQLVIRAALPDPRSVDGLRGLVSITIFNQPTGGQTTRYALLVKPGDYPNPYLTLEGPGLDALQAYNNRPVDIWGVVDHADEQGSPVVRVERFELPFPDLKLAIVRGTQKPAVLQGQPVTLFTGEEGTAYVQLGVDGSAIDGGLIGVEGDPVLLEALAIPGETFAGYPGLRVFGGGMAINPKNGEAVEVPLTADRPMVVEPPPADTPLVPPTATIDRIELVYFVNDPRFAPQESAAGQGYIQPVWRFTGHYSSGDEFEILVQALKPEFLLPEVEPWRQPG